MKLKKYRKHFFWFCAAGFLLGLLSVYSQPSPIIGYDYIEKSDAVEYTRLRKRYDINVIDGNTHYIKINHGIIDGFNNRYDLTEKDYFFDTKIMFKSCKDTKKGHKTCRAIFYDGYFYSYKYDRVFRIKTDSRYSPDDINKGYFVVFILFFGIYFAFRPLFIDWDEEK